MEDETIGITLNAHLEAAPTHSLAHETPSAPAAVAQAAPTDGELLARLNAGESEALGEIYQRHATSLYRVLVALLGANADAEDALQTVFVQLATKRPRRVRELRAYLLAMARNHALSVLRQRPRERQLEDADLNATITEAHDSEVNFAVEDWQRLLNRLPLEQREVIALKVWQEMTFAEIAKLLKISPNTAMSRYRYGIARLRQWCANAQSEEAENE